MKKLLSILLSASVVLSAFASSLTAFAYSGEDGAYYPDVYNNTLPEEVSKILGFESGSWQTFNGYSSGQIADENMEITEEDAASGSKSLKITLPESDTLVWGGKSAALGNFELSNVKLPQA